jgi:hypothetical protein
LLNSGEGIERWPTLLIESERNVHPANRGNRGLIMNRLAVGLAAMSLLVLNATQALAARGWAQINGTALAAISGACTQPGYDDQCPSGNCTCVEIPNATVGNVAGKARSLVGTGSANVFLTFDVGLEMPTGVGQCRPFFGIAEISTTTSSDPTPVSRTLNLNGVNCDPVSGSNQPVLGGFGILKNPALPSPPRKGFGEIVQGSFLNGTSPAGLSLVLHATP